MAKPSSSRRARTTVASSPFSGCSTRWPRLHDTSAPCWTSGSGAGASAGASVWSGVSSSATSAPRTDGDRLRLGLAVLLLDGEAEARAGLAAGELAVADLLV